MVPDIVEIKRLCASGQWHVKLEDGKILLHDTVAGETVCLADMDAVPVVRCRDCWKRGDDDECPMSYLIHSWTDETGTEIFTVDRTVDDGFCFQGEMKAEA